MRNVVFLVLVLSCLAGLNRSALAQDEPIFEPISVPSSDDAATAIDRIDALEAELAKLRSDLGGHPHPFSMTADPKPLDKQGGVKTEELPKLPEPAKPAAEAKKYPNFIVNGFFQADTIYFNQDAASLASVGDIQDGADIRRFRMSAKGSVAENVNYFAQLDFGFFGRPTFTDVWGEVTEVPIFGNVRVGQWKQPYSLEVVTSVRYQTFLERSLVFQTFAPFRHLGIGFYNHSQDENWTWAASVFRTGNDQFGNDIGDNGGWSSAGRLTTLAWYQKQDAYLSYLHLGGAYWWGDPSNNLFRYATIPEAFVGAFGVPAGTVPGTSKVQVPTIANGTPPFIDTGTFGVRDFINLGSELLWVEGPVSFQGEGQVALVNSTNSGNLVFPGGYAEMTYFLTGESRPYDRKAGCLDRVVPCRNFMTKCGAIEGPGAWEIACRGSYNKLNDGSIQGGQLFDVTAGLNWYLNGYTKVQFNYIRAFLENPIHGRSDTDIYALRAQVDW